MNLDRFRIVRVSCSWGRGRKRKNERNEGIRVPSPFIHTLGRVDPKPGPFPLFTGRLIQILMDMDLSSRFSGVKSLIGFEPFDH